MLKAETLSHADVNIVRTGNAACSGTGIALTLGLADLGKCSLRLWPRGSQVTICVSTAFSQIFGFVAGT